MKNLITILKNFGLSDKEAKIYLALLALESAKVSEVAKQAGVNRSSTYVVLEILRRRGLVGTSDDKDKKVRHYVSASPETILQTARSTAFKQQNVQKDIESVLPEMKALAKGTKHRPIVRIFEGKEGLINALEDALTCKEKLVRISSSVSNIDKMLGGEYFPDYNQRRIKKGIKMHGIHPDDELAEKMRRTTETFEFDIPILIPKDKYKIPADFAVYDNKIGYMTSSEGGFAILIENKELAEVMKNIFDMAWEEAKRLSTKPHRRDINSV